MPAGPEAVRDVTMVPAGPAHAALLAALHQAADPHANPWSREAYAGFLAMPSCVVRLALCDGAPCAFALAQAAPPQADLCMIAVHPDWRGRGLGRRMLAALEEALRGAGVEALILEVAADNEPALALYGGAGFGEIGRRKGYYPPAKPSGATGLLELQRTDAILMQRRLV